MERPRKNGSKQRGGRSVPWRGFNGGKRTRFSSTSPYPCFLLILLLPLPLPLPLLFLLVLLSSGSGPCFLVALLSSPSRSFVRS